MARASDINAQRAKEGSKSLDGLTCPRKRSRLSIGAAEILCDGGNQQLVSVLVAAARSRQSLAHSLDSLVQLLRPANATSPCRVMMALRVVLRARHRPGDRFLFRHALRDPGREVPVAASRDEDVVLDADPDAAELAGGV